MSDLTAVLIVMAQILTYLVVAGLFAWATVNIMTKPRGFKDAG